MIRSDLHLQPRQELGDDGDLVDTRVPETRSRNAALDEKCTSLVVARHEPHGSGARPSLERVALGIGLDVRGSIQLEHDVACRNDE